MSRSMDYLRRALLGIALALSLGFGATQALAAPGSPAREGTCEINGQAHFPREGCPYCPNGSGYCDGYNEDCICF